jgi:diketogulonate reductase-like aldo/keto reductase
MRELGVGLVPYSPLGRGFLTGTVDLSTLDGKDFRRRNPRFTGQAAQANQAIADAVRDVADAKGAAPAQVALAWVYAQEERLGVPLAPIPGTKRIKWLEQNVAALDVTLTPDELAVLDPLAAVQHRAADRRVVRHRPARRAVRHSGPYPRSGSRPAPGGPGPRGDRRRRRPGRPGPARRPQHTLGRPAASP